MPRNVHIICLLIPFTNETTDINPYSFHTRGVGVNMNGHGEFNILVFHVVYSCTVYRFHYFIVL